MEDKIKPRASARMGRCKAYTAGLDGGADEAEICLSDALARNIYRAVDAPDARPLARRTLVLAQHLADLNDADVLAGTVTFPDPA
ncbi:MAG: hypothetical protein HUJ11_05420 [Arenibacter algicola]|nr:hypothetical protein [Arenibacter algicola]